MDDDLDLFLVSIKPIVALNDETPEGDDWTADVATVWAVSAEQAGQLYLDLYPEIPEHVAELLVWRMRVPHILSGDGKTRTLGE